MFDGIAPCYDPMNRRISLGLDRYWRWRAIRLLAADSQAPVLDLGSGTADLAIAAGRRGINRTVALDFSAPMLARGKEKIERAGLEGRIWLLRGDVRTLPFADGAFEAIINSFLLRNLTDMEAALAEMARVVRPGGQLICLELAYPHLALWGPLIRFYSARIIPLLGRWLARSEPAYRYLPASIARFPLPEEVLARLRAYGWRPQAARRLFPGTAILYIATREDNS